MRVCRRIDDRRSQHAEHRARRSERAHDNKTL
jgi:hypothetical protein